jgi:hypothetical protein
MKKITTLFCLPLLKQITVAQSWQDIVLPNRPNI